MSDITAINVLVEYRGEQHIALIDSSMKDLFIGMLGAYQTGQPKHARLSPLPPEATKHLLSMRQALLDHIESKKPAPKESL